MSNVIEETWEKIGFRMRPMRRLIAVRTHPFASSVGGILIPESLTTMWGGILGNQKIVVATALSVGPDCVEAEPGQILMFLRLFFINHTKLDDGTYVGWVDEQNLIGYPENRDAQVAFTGSGSTIVAGISSGNVDLQEKEDTSEEGLCVSGEVAQGVADPGPGAGESSPALHQAEEG